MWLKEPMSFSVPENFLDVEPFGEFSEAIGLDHFSWHMKYSKNFFAGENPNVTINADAGELKDMYIFYWAYSKWINAIVGPEADAKDLCCDETVERRFDSLCIPQAKSLICSGLYGKALALLFSGGGISFNCGKLFFSEKAPETIFCAFRAVALSGRISLAARFIKAIDERLKPDIGSVKEVDSFVLSDEFLMCAAYAEAFILTTAEYDPGVARAAFLLKDLADFNDYKLPIHTLIEDYRGLTTRDHVLDTRRYR